jgi:glutaminyl-tRNA synthetase
MSTNETTPLDFIRAKIAEDVKNGKNGGKVLTRFPPEPNGYLHIGHAKSICLNFGIALEYQTRCNLRFDDTNPTKEDIKYVESIQEDIRWLGFDWGDGLYYASDYFEKIYGYAVQLIKKEKAYVCSLTADEISEYRGTLTKAGKESPYRNRSIAENLDLFSRMRAGEFEEGTHVLRAKIDMNSPNINMRDPTLYRIRKAHHHRTGDQWCIYPMYDFTHCLSDSLEGITHSLCSLEFENHRPLYDWFLDELEVECHPQQIEFARLNLTHTVMSKRKFLKLVNENYVEGWDDPRMPTIAGMRRRGYTAKAIRHFCEAIGVAKRENYISPSLLEHYVREDLNETALRVMAVLRPLKVVIENYPENQVEELVAPYHPEKESYGVRKVPFTRELYIEREDFMEDPPKKFFRLAPGREVRLRYGYFITCVGVVKDSSGAIQELRCTYDPETRGGNAPDGRKVKATLHWVSATKAIPAEVRLYDTLFSKEDPEEESGVSFVEHLNPQSLEKLKGWLEPSLAQAKPGEHYQFERVGYFYVDPQKSLVFNRTVSLKDGGAKIKE